MVCVPCFIVPVLLLVWRFLLWPIIRPLYLRFYPENDQKMKNETVEKLDSLGDDGCPFGCPLKPKEKNISAAEEKKIL